MSDAVEPPRHILPRLEHVLQAARMGSIEAMERVLAQAQAGEPEPHENAAAQGTPYLMFRCEDIACAAPLDAFREVLPGLPGTIPLPDSPPWMLGLFLLRTELLALVDPAPFVLGHPATAWPLPENVGDIGMASTMPAMTPGTPTALVVGSGETTLALAVREVGSIVTVRDEELRTQAPVSQVTPRYARGIYVPEGTHERYLVPNISALLDDLLRGLAEGEDLRHV